jgi:hypothetical protein
MRQPFDIGLGATEVVRHVWRGLLQVACSSSLMGFWATFL